MEKEMPGIKTNPSNFKNELKKAFNAMKAKGYKVTSATPGAYLVQEAGPNQYGGVAVYRYRSGNWLCEAKRDQGLYVGTGDPCPHILLSQEYAKKNE